MKNHPAKQKRLCQFQFPVSFGTVLVSWSANELLTGITWSPRRVAVWQPVEVPEPLEVLIDQLRAFSYRGEPLRAIPWDRIEQSTWSEFQKRVYFAVAEIPHGETRTYGWVAKSLGMPSATLAVGQALKKNPLPILIPCHRVVSAQRSRKVKGGQDQFLVDYSPQGLKRILINLEEEYLNPIFPFLEPATTWLSQTHIEIA